MGGAIFPEHFSASPELFSTFLVCQHPALLLSTAAPGAVSTPWVCGKLTQAPYLCMWWPVLRPPDNSVLKPQILKFVPSRCPLNWGFLRTVVEPCEACGVVMFPGLPFG